MVRFFYRRAAGAEARKLRRDFLRGFGLVKFLEGDDSPVREASSIRCAAVLVALKWRFGQPSSSQAFLPQKNFSSLSSILNRPPTTPPFSFLLFPP